ncbi:MAG: erythromycin esterase family protein [Candidatus Aminicenantes bacterium]|nr:MAG: erythromycin esterase family protein [Candidatus Aminicenantes bacterium]
MLKIFKTFIIMICIFFLLVTSFSCQMGDSQSTTPSPETGSELTEQEQRLIQELNDWLIPLEASPLELTDNELSFLDQLSSAKMVGLGEATHGTREFFQMKHRVFQYLVENFNHKAYGFEADFAECIYLNNYVTKGEGDLLDLMRTKMHFWTWRTQEVKELLEWMRNYNTGKSEETKIHYIGFDCQYTDLQPDLIQAYLEPLLADLWETASSILDQVKNLSNDDYKAMSQEEYNSIKAQLESLETQLEANKDQLVADSSNHEYEITRQLFRTFRQAFIVLYSYYGSSNDNTNWRDLYMAENAQWIADLFGEDTKITLWAHNAHLANWRQYGGSGTMGYHLKEALNDLYQVMGFAFSKGSFTVGYQSHEITDEPRRDSINFIFHHASHANFVFHLDAIPAGSEWDNWLSQPRPFLWLGAAYNGNPFNYYWSTKLNEHYNWIIYFDTTNASNLIPR